MKSIYNINSFYTRKRSIIPPVNKESDPGSYRKNMLILILLLSAYRCLLAFVMELGNDETYYWLYSQQLQWNYFDHPPMVAIWIRLFTFNLSLDHLEGFIRLGSVIGSAICTWMIYKTVTLIHSEKAGWYAAILYNASFYAGITAGLYILPDSPEMVFWTFSLWTIARIIRDDRNLTSWILFGLATGLCIMSKVHGVFIWFGFGLWILFFKRAWLKKPQLYLAAILTAVIISPILIWNFQYDFATWRYHSQRVEVQEFLVNWKSFIKQLASQLGFNNPVNVLVILGALMAWKHRPIKRNEVLSIYNLIGLPLALILLVISIFRDTPLPHWSGPAYVTLLPLAAIYLAEGTKKIFTYIPRISLAIFLFVYCGWAMVVEYFPGTYIKDKESLGRGDITVDMYGWRDAGKQFASLYVDDISSGRMLPGRPMVTSHWWGAHVEYYFCRPLDMYMIGLGERTGHYLWLNKNRMKLVDLNQAYCVVPSADRYRIPFDYYEQVQLARVIDISRNGKPAHRFFVYRLYGLKKAVPFK